MTPSVRIARPVSDLKRSQEMYVSGLHLAVVDSFSDHDGFDGVMIGIPGSSFHFELTRHRSHPIAPTPTVEDLVVFYIPDAGEWQKACDDVLNAGFRQVQSHNPYWDIRGRTFEDHDGYRIVLAQDHWAP